MTSKAARLLLTKIVPILKATVPRTVRPTGCEDAEELVQDTIASAAEMLDSVEKAGKRPIPRSIAFYSIQRAKTGRRAYQCSRNDVLGPMFRTAAEECVSYMDAALLEESEQHATLHDRIAGHREDPASEALRRMDWEEFAGSIDRKEKLILDDVAGGVRGKETARALGVSGARVVQLKRELASRIKAFMGEDILKDISEEPQWRKDLRCIREMDESRHAARIDDDEPEAA